MNPNERRALANDLTHHIRRGWLKHRATTSHSPTGNPRGHHYSSAGGFPAPTSNPTTDEIERHQYVRALTLADETLRTRSVIWQLIRSEYDATLSRLPVETQAVWCEFLEESRALPFHQSGGRLRWASDKCPSAAQRAALRLTLACTVEYPDPRDVSDEYADEDEMRPSDLFRTLGLETRVLVPS